MTGRHNRHTCLARKHLRQRFLYHRRLVRIQREGLSRELNDWVPQPSYLSVSLANICGSGSCIIEDLCEYKEKVYPES